MALTITMIFGTISLLIVLLSFGYLRNFVSKNILSRTSKLILKVMGYKGEFPKPEQFPKYPAFYTFNHNSYLDIFLLTGLAIPNSRYLFSTKTLKHIPLVIAAKALGTFYIPMQDRKERRLRFLKRLTKFLQKNRVSMIASSEGVRPFYHGIMEFNRGVYHVALEAELPIIPLFIHIPEEMNPYMGNRAARGGTVRIEMLDEISTKDWSLKNLENHIRDVRDVFVKRFNTLNPTNKTE